MGGTTPKEWAERRRPKNGRLDDDHTRLTNRMTTPKERANDDARRMGRLDDDHTRLTSRAGDDDAQRTGGMMTTRD